MPVMHYTQHTYGSWMPDRPQGYVHHDRGLQSQNPKMNLAYRRHKSVEVVNLTAEQQRRVVGVLRNEAGLINDRVHSVATDDAHFHVLLSWKDDRSLRQVYASIRKTISLCLNRDFGKRCWFTKHGHLVQVKSRTHFDHLIDVYHPSHPSWCWSEAKGLREPLR
jgi:hypothetical protein